MKLKLPQPHTEDPLYNRRLMAYAGLLFSILWSQEVLLAWVLLVANDKTPDASVMIALLGVPAAIAGLGYWKYLEAAKKDDLK